MSELDLPSSGSHIHVHIMRSVLWLHRFYSCTVCTGATYSRFDLIMILSFPSFAACLCCRRSAACDTLNQAMALFRTGNAVW